MSIKTKKRFKNLAKIVGIALFSLLMFTNIKIAMLDDDEIASGDISLFGIEMNLFDATYGETAGSCSASADCGAFTVYCSTTGDITDCVGYDYAYVQCKAWNTSGALTYFTYKPCP